jgi:hypothetical protein
MAYLRIFHLNSDLLHITPIVQFRRQNVNTRIPKIQSNVNYKKNYELLQNSCYYLKESTINESNKYNADHLIRSVTQKGVVGQNTRLRLSFLPHY